MVSHRVLDYSYASFNPVSAEHLDTVLEAETTQRQRRIMHLDFEKRMKDYELPFWRRDPGSGFVQWQTRVAPVCVRGLCVHGCLSITVFACAFLSGCVSVCLCVHVCGSVICCGGKRRLCSRAVRAK